MADADILARTEKIKTAMERCWQVSSADCEDCNLEFSIDCYASAKEDAVALIDAQAARIKELEAKVAELTRKVPLVEMREERMN